MNNDNTPKKFTYKVNANLPEFKEGIDNLALLGSDLYYQKLCNSITEEEHDIMKRRLAYLGDLIQDIWYQVLNEHSKTFIDENKG